MSQERPEYESTPYAERRLHELLDSTCEKLYPSTGFTLEFQGLVPDMITKKGLEAYGGVPLDPKAGATIKLAYDIAEQQLVLQSIVHPIDQLPSSSLVLQRTNDRTEGLEYISFLEISGREFTPTASKKDRPITQSDIHRILQGYGIHDIPHPTHESYRLWRANALSSCKKGWDISEEVELFVDMQEHKTETIKVKVNEKYQESDSISHTKQISHVFNIAEESGAYSQTLESSLIQIHNKHGRVLHLYNELTQKEHQPFVLGDKGIVLKNETESIKLDLDAFNAFRGLLEDATSYLHEEVKES